MVEPEMAGVKGWQSKDPHTVTVCTWVEQDDGSKAAQLRFIHLHVPHLTHKLGQNPAEVKTDVAD